MLPAASRTAKRHAGVVFCREATAGIGVSSLRMLLPLVVTS